MESTAKSLIVLLSNSTVVDKNTLQDYLPLIRNCISYYKERNSGCSSELCRCRREIESAKEKSAAFTEERAEASALIQAQDSLRLATFREENDSLIDQITYAKMSMAQKKEQAEAHEDILNEHKLIVSENQIYIRKLRQKLNAVQLERNQVLSVLCKRGDMRLQRGVTREMKNNTLSCLKSDIQPYAGSPSTVNVAMFTGERSSQWSHGSSTRPEE